MKTSLTATAYKFLFRALIFLVGLTSAKSDGVTPLRIAAPVATSPTMLPEISTTKDSVEGSANCVAGNHSREQEEREGEPLFTSEPSRELLFSSEHHAAFERDGFLIVSGLLDDDELETFVQAGHEFFATKAKNKSFFAVVDMGLIFNAGMEGDPTITNTFRRIAIDSKIPQAAAELLGLPPSQNVRILRDVFMSKSIDEDSVCDWHVDDIGFWPEAYDNKQEGINAWIAMDDMPASFQGSMALSPGSHRADEWRFDAYSAIGQNRTSNGGFTKEEIKRRVENGEKLKTTCDIGKEAPELRARIEETIYIPDLKKGDVIFATRTLFHRTLAVTEIGKAHYKNQGSEYLNRYSIRYVPGTAQLPSGWGFEWSIVTNSDNSGRTLDAVMGLDENMWYPRVWPTTEDNIEAGLDRLAGNTLATAKENSRTEIIELITLFSKQ